MIATSLLFVSWVAALAKVFASLDSTSVDGVLALTYPIADVLLVSVAVSTVASSTAIWRRPLCLATIGLVVLASADIGFAYLEAGSDYETGSIVDLGWIIGWLLLALYAGVAPMDETVPQRRCVESPGIIMTTVPLVTLSLVVAVGTTRHLMGNPFTNDPVLRWLGLTIFVLNAARSLASQLEADTRAAELGAQTTDLTDVLDRHGLALKAASMGTFSWDRETDLIDLSPELSELLIVELGTFGGTLPEAMALVHPDDRDRAAVAFTAAVEVDQDFTVECRLLCPDGAIQWVQSRGHSIADEHGTVTRVVGVVGDVTEQHMVRQRVEMRAQQGAALAELGNRALVAATIQETLDDVAAIVPQVLNVDLSEVSCAEGDAGVPRLVAGCGGGFGVVGSAAVTIGDSSPAGFARLCNDDMIITDLVSDNRFRGLRYRRDHCTSSGLTAVIHTSTGPWGVLGVFDSRCHDFSTDDVNFVRAAANIVGAAIDRVRVEEQLRHQCLHDSLTKLPNRQLFLASLDIGIASARRRRQRLAVLHVDLDRFALVNESFGYQCGDTVLTQVSQRLRAISPQGDVLARLEGDSFGLMLTVGTDAAIRDTSAKVLAAIGQPLVVDSEQEEVFLSASVGIAIADGDCDGETLLRDAAIAARRALSNGGRRYELFDECPHEQARERVQIEGELHHALAGGQIKAHYQPIVRIKDGAIVGFEALARWEHPTRGLLLPNYFIEISESAGLIGRLGEAILSQAAGQAASWNSPRTPLIKVSANVSPTQLDSEFVDVIRAVLESTGAPAESLCLEVVEDALTGDCAAQRVLELVRQLGPLSVHIDDFGTGHSSLSRLTSLPVNGVKIDRSFVTHLVDNRSDRAVAAAIIALAHAIGLEVTAEGVETVAQLRILRDLDCDLAQGWLFSAALPAGDCEGLVAAAQTAYTHVVSGEYEGTLTDDERCDDASDAELPRRFALTNGTHVQRP